MNDGRLLYLRELISDKEFYKVGKKTVNGYDYDAFLNQPESLALLFMSISSYVGMEFVVYEDERYTFDDILTKSETLAFGLQKDFKIKSGDNVCLMYSNKPEWIISFIAISLLGAVVVPIGDKINSDVASYIVEHSESKLVIVESKKAAKYLLKNNDIQILSPYKIMSGASKIWSELIDKYIGNKPNRNFPLADDLAVIIYTSGSTGRPRGVMCTNRNIISSLMSWAYFGYPYDKTDYDKLNPFKHSCLVGATLSHATSCYSLFLLSCLIGRKVVLMSTWDAKKAADLMVDEEVTYFNGVPTMTFELASIDNISDYDFTKLTHISSAGSKRPGKHVELIKSKLPNTTIMSGYGATETNAMGTIAFGDDYLQNPDSAGFPVEPLVEVAIMDEGFNKCDTNVKGEICIRTVSNSVGYWNDPEGTIRAFKDGWHLSGDVGYIDEDKRLYVVGRIKDIVICGGENVSCFEVESAIFKIESVDDVTVFPLHDDRLGEVAAAVIYTNEAVDLSEDSVQSYLSDKLEWYKVPQKIWFTNKELPVLYNGKPDKTTVMNIYLNP